MGLRTTTELWQSGIIHAPISSLLTPNALSGVKITWLPEPLAFTFLADPFGIAHDGGFTVFVEALDYRVKRGEIHYFTYDAEWKIIAQGIALQAPYHLSYPHIIREGGEIYMLPEASRSGKLTLYRAKQFPHQWEPVATLLEQPAIDASVIFYQGKWWMFYALPGPDGRALRELHIAYANQLTGPWRQHEANPVRVTLESARPGGTPFMHEEKLYLPTQYCVGGYGRALNILRIDLLTPTAFTAELVQHLGPEKIHPKYPDGCHTLSNGGDVTLIDVKRMDRSVKRRWINMQRRVRRILPS